MNESINEVVKPWRALDDSDADILPHLLPHLQVCFEPGDAAFLPFHTHKMPDSLHQHPIVQGAAHPPGKKGPKQTHSVGGCANAVHTITSPGGGVTWPRPCI